MTRNEALELLKLSDGANRTQIRRAYSEQTRQYHVETHPEEFERLYKAYQLLLSSLKTAEVVEEKTALGRTTEVEEKAIEAVGKKRIKEIKEKKEIKETKDKTVTTEKKTTMEEMLDRLVHPSFSVRKSPELIQLFYHLCREEEQNPDEVDQLLIKHGMATEEQERYIEATFGVSPEWEAAPDEEELFLQLPWRKWASQGFLALICHPEFVRKQYEKEFLEKLCLWLEEETLNHRDGISQELYFALCMAYPLFLEEESGHKGSSGSFDSSMASSALNGLKKLLYVHPKHQEYFQDLNTWENLKQDARLVCFCQRAVLYEEKRVEERSEELLVQESIVQESLVQESLLQETLLLEAEELFLQNSSSQRAFILQNLESLSGTLFSVLFPQRRKSFQAFQSRCQECVRAFSESMLDITQEGNSPYQIGYVTYWERLEHFKRKYDMVLDTSRQEWKQNHPVYSSIFVQALKQYMTLPDYSTVYPYISYVLWRELCFWFSGSTPLEQDALSWLKSAACFQAYERRWQRECAWREEHIEETYFQEILPVPDLNQGKRELLSVVRQGILVEASQIQQIFHNLSLDRETADTFLIHLTNAMIRFRFLLVTQKQEQDPVPEDVFCFLEQKVWLYRKKENQACQMSHQAFFDMLSRTIDLLGQQDSFPGAVSGQSATNQHSLRYHDAFLDTVCKNLYLYECYIKQKLSVSSN